jgi:hypothetical protein
MNDRGRRREHPAEGYYSTSEAAEILDVSTGTVINMIKRGELEGGQYLTRANEPRWELTKESVNSEAENRGRPANFVEMRREFQVRGAELALEVIQRLSDEVHKQGEAQTNEIQVNREVFMEAAGELMAVIRSQETNVSEKCDRAVSAIEEMAEGQKEYQELVLARIDRAVAALESADERQTESEEQAKPERRGFWHKLFAG